MAKSIKLVIFQAYSSLRDQNVANGNHFEFFKTMKLNEFKIFILQSWLKIKMAANCLILFF